MRSPRLIIIPLILLFLSACAANPQGTAPVVATSPTNALAAIATRATIAPDWRGIPIMPGAAAGEGDVDGYVFVIYGTTDQVRNYYGSELPKSGWESMPTDDESIMLFMRNGGTESLTINILEKDSQVLVLLTK